MLLLQPSQIHAMNLKVSRNIAFTRLVKAAERLREFNFRKTFNTSLSHDVFHVDVSDDRGNRIMFTMLPEEGQHWRIREEGLPEWVSVAEPHLDNLIREELS